MVWVLNADFHASKIYVQVEGHRPWVLCADFDFKGKAIICDPGEYADVSKVRYKNHINPLENALPRLPRSPSNPFVSWSTQTLKRRVDSRFASKMPKWSLINHVANLYFKNVPNRQLHKRHRVKIIRWVNLSLNDLSYILTFTWNLQIAHLTCTRTVLRVTEVDLAPIYF